MPDVWSLTPSMGRGMFPIFKTFSASCYLASKFKKKITVLSFKDNLPEFSIGKNFKDFNLDHSVDNLVLDVRFSNCQYSHEEGQWFSSRVNMQFSVHIMHSVLVSGGTA